MNVHMSRRGFIFGAAAFSIVRPEILMPIKKIEVMPTREQLWNLAVDLRMNEMLRLYGMPYHAFPTPQSWVKAARILAEMGE